MSKTNPKAGTAGQAAALLEAIHLPNCETEE